MSEYPYSFTAKVELHHVGGGSPQFRVIFLPEEIAARLKPKQHLRLEGEINGIRFEGAVQSSKSGWYVMVSKKLLKICGLDVGRTTTVEFDVGDQDAVDVPDELYFALQADEEARRAWAAITSGRRRTFAHRVGSAKLRETRLHRVEEVIEQLKTPPKSRGGG